MLLSREGHVGPRPLAVPVSVVAGVILGAAAGLIGVGGGEFRIPVLLYLLRQDVKTAASVNLVVGFLTVALSFARRWGQHTWSSEQLTVAGLLTVASMMGALVGARYAHRFPSRGLLRVVVGYLLAVGAWMIIEALTQTEVHLLTPGGAMRAVLALVGGFVIAALAAALGVAGGEMRIPALMYLFGYDVRIAGTLSLFASIPTVAAGAFTYRQLGYLPDWALRIALAMGAGSLAGVLAGTALLPRLDSDLLKGLLGAVLLLATGALLLPAFRRDHSRGAA